MIKTHLALLHDMNGKEEEAIASMQEALDICDRLKRPVNRLGREHSDDVSHKKDFPKSKFPHLSLPW